MKRAGRAAFAFRISLLLSNFDIVALAESVI
jgi:hypothetical protein